MSKAVKNKKLEWSMDELEYINNTYALNLEKD